MIIQYYEIKFIIAICYAPNHKFIVPTAFVIVLSEILSVCSLSKHTLEISAAKTRINASRAHVIIISIQKGCE